MLNKVITGFFSLPRAAKFVIGHPSLLPYIFIPFLISLSFLCGTWAIWKNYDAMLLGYLGGGGEGWWSWFLNVFSGLVFGVFAWYSFSMVGMVLSSPFNDLLVVKVLKARGFVVQELSFWISIKNAIFDSLKVLLFKIVLTFMGALFPPLFIPFIILMVVMDYFDYPWSHQTSGLWGRLKCLKRDAPEALGFGAFFSILFIVPFVGLFCMPLAIVGAAMLVNPSK